MLLNLLVVVAIGLALLLFHRKADMPPNQKWLVTVVIGGLVLLWLIIGAAPQKDTHLAPRPLPRLEP